MDDLRWQRSSGATSSRLQSIVDEGNSADTSQPYRNDYHSSTVDAIDLRYRQYISWRWRCPWTFRHQAGCSSTTCNQWYSSEYHLVHQYLSRWPNALWWTLRNQVLHSWTTMWWSVRSMIFPLYRIFFCVFAIRYLGLYQRWRRNWLFTWILPDYLRLQRSSASTHRSATMLYRVGTLQWQCILCESYRWKTLQPLVV